MTITHHSILPVARQNIVNHKLWRCEHWELGERADGSLRSVIHKSTGVVTLHCRMRLCIRLCDK